MGCKACGKKKRVNKLLPNLNKAKTTTTKSRTWKKKR